MTRPTASRTGLQAHLAYYLLVGLIVVIWIAGGASRPDVIGQPLVRFFAVLALASFLAFSSEPRLRIAKTPALFVCLTAALVLAQLVPLPPAVWTALPGRSLLAGVSAISGDPLPWRPLSMSPGWTLNSLGSLIVPTCVLVLASNVDRERHIRLLGVLLGLALVSALLGLVQLSGGRFDHPLLNDVPGMISGNFANRNHFALYLAISCVLSWTWAASGRSARWKGPAALALYVFFALLCLATGSRAGLVLLVIASGASIVLARRSIARQFERLDRRVALITLAAALAAVVALISVTLIQDKAEAVSRVALGSSQPDSRLRLIPLTAGLAAEYFPFGTGFGTFDPVFRISEPIDLLGPEYFNHAHSDLVEVPLEGGAAGLMILLGGLIWIARVTWRSWHPAGPGRSLGLARAGTAILVLVALASATDYPARTPMIMSLIVLGAVWATLRDHLPEATEGAPH